ncbi:putative thymine dioxygenase protein [Botrytis fragariae]|uniref:Putative thymine dioxygenase protein n=1 Tax=Botrytis fragariae TaxID=1964551 RepID=A0A8H6B3N4_9HELO|nr:putative thymine dioxygenase protein [Botrytis fragariae]KAF5878427.1 putative thymine dioxygenase protein [Botrytis fragariae]
MTQARYSIPYFCGPDTDKSIEVLEECAQEGEKRKYEAIVVGEYFKMRSALAYQRNNGNTSFELSAAIVKYQ